MESIKWLQGSANVLGNEGEFEIYEFKLTGLKILEYLDEQIPYKFKNLNNAKAVAEIIKLDQLGEQYSNKI